MEILIAILNLIVLIIFILINTTALILGILYGIEYFNNDRNRARDLSILFLLISIASVEFIRRF